MPHLRSTSKEGHSRSASSGGGEINFEHYARVLWHRKWLILVCFVVCSVGTAIWASRLPNIYVSETVILVDPQKVPEAYVKPTITGDVRNRLSTLSQQILSATRLQKIIDSLNLYPEDKKVLAREDIITRMRRDISVQVVSDFGASQDLQAFRIGFSGREPKLVAQVTNELASLFIEENLKAREQQATGTSDFLQNQLEETRKTLEGHEARLAEFKLKHIGEVPEQQAANLQILGQLQSQLQLESDALNRAEQQRSYIQSMMASQSSGPVVDLDATEPGGAPKAAPAAAPAKSPLGNLRAQLERALERYSEDHPDVKRLKRLVQDEEQRASRQAASVAAPATPVEQNAPAATVVRRSSAPSGRNSNPVLESQLRTIDGEIGKRKEEQQRLAKMVARYQQKLEAIPVREQQMANLVRDYEISKAHYKQLLEKQLSAQTATQLEIRQKGERFTVLDPAQPAERPDKPNRKLINAAGSLAGLMIGLLLALSTEFLGMSITGPEQIIAATGLPVLEVIPLIETHTDRLVRRRRMFIGAACAAVAFIGGCAALVYQLRDRFL